MTRNPGPAGGIGSRHGEADDSLGLVLWQVTNRWQAAQRAALKPFGLTHVQYVLLASLAWLDADGPVTQRALADHAATDPMMTSQVLRALEARNLIRRTEDSVDKRARAVSVTAAGSTLAVRATQSVEACDEAFFGPLGQRSHAFAAALLALRDGPDVRRRTQTDA